MAPTSLYSSVVATVEAAAQDEARALSTVTSSTKALQQKVHEITRHVDGRASSCKSALADVSVKLTQGADFVATRCVS